MGNRNRGFRIENFKVKSLIDRRDDQAYIQEIQFRLFIRSSYC